MKNKLFFSCLVLFGFATVCNAQATATATATATIITPISITKNTDMNFGNIAVQTATGGTVILAPASTRTSTGGVTLPAAAGTVTAAAFTVNGLGTSTYAITLPTTVSLINGAANMAATAFVSSVGPTGTLTGGTQNFTVGATLTVAAAQLAGTYVSAAFNVTVNYN